MPTPDYLLGVLKPLLKHPDDARVDQTRDDMGVLLSVHVNKEDMGIVVGKGGETANAVRHLVRIVGLKGNARVSVKIVEPDSDYQKPA